MSPRAVGVGAAVGERLRPRQCSVFSTTPAAPPPKRVADCDDDVAEQLPERFYLSAAFTSRNGGGNERVDVEPRSIGLVEQSATIGKQAAVAVDGDLDTA